jgi:uncharacterized protein YggE
MRAAPLALTIALLTAPTLALAAEPGVLTLSAVGVVRRVPDMATIALGVAAQAPTAAQALAADSAQMARVIAALRRQGVAERDIQTSNLNVQPQYAFAQNEPQRLTGYQASNQVTVTVRDLARLGAVVDGAAGGGANEVSGVSFGVHDPSAAEDEARRLAVTALKAKAELYAKATGYSLGRLTRLSEGGGYAPDPVRPMAKMAAMAATPVEAGELEVRIQVEGVYDLGG